VSSASNPFMQIAYDEALKGMNCNDGGPFGAIIVYNVKVIASAHSEVLKTNDPTSHAEINAIRKASAILGRFDLSDCLLYTTCYPCPMCMGAIFWARIPTIYYASTMEDAARGGFDDSLFYAMIQNPEASLDLRPIDTETTNKLFDLWRAKSNRHIY
jgi:guanine deaminase